MKWELQRPRAMKPYTRRIAALTFALGLLLGVGVAYAATTTINAGQISAGSGTVSSCDTSFDLTFGIPAYDASSGSYVVNTIDYSNIALACNGENLALTVANSSGTSLASAVFTVDGTSGTLTLPNSVSAADAATLIAAIYS